MCGCNKGRRNRLSVSAPVAPASAPLELASAPAPLRLEGVIPLVNNRRVRLGGIRLGKTTTATLKKTILLKKRRR